MYAKRTTIMRTDEKLLHYYALGDVFSFAKMRRANIIVPGKSLKV